MMMRILSLLAVLATASCGPAGSARGPTSPAAPAVPAVALDDRTPMAPAAAADDGTYLDRIDPLGGQWTVERLGAEDFRRFNARIDFSGGGFLNHGAGCNGGFPAFYRLDDQRFTLTRREEVRIGKCASVAAADSERRLASFLDEAVTWHKPDARNLILTRKDGSLALLSRPVEPYPEIAGRWIIQTIGSSPLITERRPPTVSISMGSISAHADCNSFGGPFTIPTPGRITVAKQLVSTAIGCPPEDAAEDALMAKAMASATAYRLENGRLLLSGGQGMILRRPLPANRQLAGEYEACGNTLLGAYHEGPITLAVDQHMMRDNAGCSADYVAQGPRLILRLDASAACARASPPFVPGEPVGVGGQISMLAVTRPDGFGFDDQGRLILRTARGLLSMCRKGSPPPFGG